MFLPAKSLFLLLFLMIPAIQWCWAEKSSLPRDTTLPVQGVAMRGTNVIFAGGTTVLLNDQKEVRSGVLAKDTALAIPGHTAPVLFKMKTQVIFSFTGHVQQGIMLGDNTLKIEGSAKSLKFKGGLPVYFGQEGITAGTLAEQARLAIPMKKGVEEDLPAGTYVMFTITGQVYMVTPPRK
jgi:hypothetical protein